MPTLEQPLSPENLTQIIEGIERADKVISAMFYIPVYHLESSSLMPILIA